MPRAGGSFAREYAMSQSVEFYQARAAEAAEEARQSSLENVRERALRSEAAWRVMADRALKIERDRKVAAVERAERRAAEDGLD